MSEVAAETVSIKEEPVAAPAPMETDGGELQGPEISFDSNADMDSGPVEGPLSSPEPADSGMAAPVESSEAPPVVSVERKRGRGRYPRISQRLQQKAFELPGKRERRPISYNHMLNPKDASQQGAKPDSPYRTPVKSFARTPGMGGVVGRPPSAKRQKTSPGQHVETGDEPSSDDDEPRRKKADNGAGVGVGGSLDASPSHDADGGRAKRVRKVNSLYDEFENTGEAKVVLTSPPEPAPAPVVAVPAPIVHHAQRGRPPKNRPIVNPDGTITHVPAKRPAAAPASSSRYQAKRASGASSPVDEGGAGAPFSPLQSPSLPRAGRFATKTGPTRMASDHYSKRNAGVDQLPPIMRVCLKIVKTILRDSRADPFAQPVDAVRLNIPTYFDVIKRPMDLGTVRARVERNHYQTPLDFAMDMRLIFDNCATFNPPESKIRQQGEELRGEFESMFGLIQQELDSEVSRKFMQIAELSRTYDAFWRAANKGRRKGKDARLKPPSEETSDIEDMTAEERQDLAKNLAGLTPEQLGMVLGIVHEMQPTYKDAHSAEINLDIDVLDATTLRCLERFASVCFQRRSLAD